MPMPSAVPADTQDGETGQTQLDIADQGDDEQIDPDQQTLRKELEKYYWCQSTGECIESLVDRSSEYYQYIVATGKMALWRLVFEQYNRGYITLGSVSRGGTEGELLNLPINEFRNIIDHLVGLSTQDKLAFEPQPVNNDYTTSAQLTLCKGILNDYAKNKDLEPACERVALNTYLFGEGDCIKLWDNMLGGIRLVDTANQQILRQGDVQFVTVNPTNLIRDIHIQDFKENQWFIARIFVNKYDLAAKYPKKAREICAKTIATDWDNTRITATRGEKSDLVPLYMAFHKITTALPFGRQLFYLDKETWLEDGHLESRDFPVFTNMPHPVESINFGYTTAYDLLPCQQILDIIDGGHATNLSNFLVNNILVPDGCNLGVADLIGSMNLLKYQATAGKPEALNLVKFPPEGPQFRQFVVERMEVLAGISSTVRAQPDEKITSGTMAALYASQAIHFNSKFQKSYARFCGELATGIIHDLQDHPEDQRTGLVAGKGNKSYLKEFYGKDVNMIDRVTVQVGSAFLQTDAGKVAVADGLMASPQGLDPREYLEVIETGSLEPLVEGPHRELLFIKQENEFLSEGKPCKVIITDDHVTHIKEHKNVTMDPDLRARVAAGDKEADTVMNNALTHIADHEHNIQMGGQNRPTLMGILGQPVPQAGPPPPAARMPPKPMMKRPMPGKPAPMAPGRAPAGPGRPAPAPMAKPTPMAAPGAKRGSVPVPSAATPPPVNTGAPHP